MWRNLCNFKAAVNQHKQLPITAQMKHLQLSLSDDDIVFIFVVIIVAQRRRFDYSSLIMIAFDVAMLIYKPIDMRDLGKQRLKFAFNRRNSVSDNIIFDRVDVDYAIG